MSQDDFFSFDDKTRILRPTPGGQNPRNPFESPVKPAPIPPTLMPSKLDLSILGDNKTLVSAALPLLSLVAGLGNSVSHPDVAGLRNNLAGEVEKFNTTLLRQGTSADQVWKATYAVCLLLDETIQKTPWGVESQWAKQNLSILFRKDTWGGEGFFDIVDNLLRQPETNLPLIELFYLCLSLGFEGKFGKMNNGQAELEKYRQELYLILQRQWDGWGQDLSVRWQGLKQLGNRVMRMTPWWVLAAFSGAILVLAYAAFLFNMDSEPTRAQLASLSHEPIKLAGALPVIHTPPPPQIKTNRFDPLLSYSGVEVIDDNKIIIRESFLSGSAEVKPEFLPLLQKTAEILVAGQDTVQVIGHTDSNKIKNFRFHDNWELSKARAKHVADVLMTNGAAPEKVKWAGRAFDEPLEPNDKDSVDARARNRRVEIVVLH